MSDRLADTFNFKGRLSRGGQRRIQYKLLAFALVGWVAPLLLLIAGAPGVLAMIPFVILPIVALGLVAAAVRRFHDVDLHAHREMLIYILGTATVIGPFVIIAMVPDLPQPIAYGLMGLSVLTLLAGFMANLRGRPEWGPGDPDTNEFGPPPSR